MFFSHQHNKNQEHSEPQTSGKAADPAKFLQLPHPTAVNIPLKIPASGL